MNEAHVSQHKRSRVLAQFSPHMVSTITLNDHHHHLSDSFLVAAFSEDTKLTSIPQKKVKRNNKLIMMVIIISSSSISIVISIRIIKPKTKVSFCAFRIKKINS